MPSGLLLLQFFAELDQDPDQEDDIGPDQQLDEVVGADIPSRPPLPRLRRAAYDDFNPLEPPLTVYTEYRFDNLPPLPHHSPTSPVSSRDNAHRHSPSMEPTSHILRSQSLPPKRRRRHHHRSHRNPIIAPITFTKAVTLEEAPSRDDSSSSSAARPMASSARPPPRVDPYVPTYSESHSFQTCIS